MIRIEVPGRERPYEIKYILLDYNGTIARDGLLLEGAAERIRALSERVPVYVLTADTYGNVRRQCEGIGAEVRTFPSGAAAPCKEAIAKELGRGVCAIGNGFNDIQMLDAADLAICVMEREGAYAGLLAHADLVVGSPEDALDLLLKPDRLRAGLRW